MRKKYLSALLFGALLFASAGTFTSCKDYDDDINNLQNQIDANAKGLEELKSLVENGDYVTGVEKSAEGIVVTFKNGGTKTITLEDKVGSVVTVNEDGVLCIDGEPTEIKVAETTPGEAAKAPVKIDGGFWAVLNDNGEYTKTNIPVSGVSLAGDEKTGYTLTIVNADGSSTSVDLPTATSSMVDLDIVDIKHKYKTTAGGADVEVENGVIALAQYEFTLKDPLGASKKKSDWKGSIALPDNGTKIVAQVVPVMIQINPTNVDGKDVEFELVNSKNAVADVDFVVKDFTDLLAIDDDGALSRTANANGLYDLTIADQQFKDAAAAVKYLDALKTDDQALAVAAGSVRSAYKVRYVEQIGVALSTYTIKDLDIEDQGVNSKLVSTNVTGRLELNKWYTVTTDVAAALYDMRLSVPETEKVLYGFESKLENGAYQFMVTKTPDNVTKPAINLTIETVDKKGTWNTATAQLPLSEIISDAYVYDAVEYELKDDVAAKNAFSVSAPEMTSKFNDEQLALWKKKIDHLAPLKVVDKDGKDVTFNGGLTLVMYKEDGSTTTDVMKAATFSLQITNATLAASDVKLDTQYYAVIEGQDENGNTLNTAKVPFTLSLPDVKKFFVEQPGVFVDGVANAYMDETAVAGTVKAASYDLKGAFNKFGENMTNTTFTIELEGSTKLVGNNTSKDLATLATTGVAATNRIPDVNKAKAQALTVTLYDGTNDDKLVDKETGLQAGYKQELIVKVTNVKFANAWSYGDAGNYTFKIKLMSPLYEGTVSAVGSVVEIPATDIDGHAIDGNDIVGYTYNNISYSIFADKAGVPATSVDWTRKELADVTFATTDANIFTFKDGATETAGQPFYTGTDPEKDPDKNGYVVVYPQNLAATTDSEIEVTITDAWGYKKTVKVPVRVTVK